MRNTVKCLLAAAALSAFASVSARAQDIEPLLAHQWNEFQFQGPGSLFQDYSGTELDYVFTIYRPKVLTVTDGWNDGDQFDVIINGFDTGPTSTPALDAKDVGACYSCAVGKFAASFSHASFLLGPGSYVVQGFTWLSPYGSGTGAMSVGSVPEPATWTMMIGGLGLLGAAVRRRRALAS